MEYKIDRQKKHVKFVRERKKTSPVFEQSLLNLGLNDEHHSVNDNAICALTISQATQPDRTWWAVRHSPPAVGFAMEAYGPNAMPAVMGMAYALLAVFIVLRIAQGRR